MALPDELTLDLPEPQILLHFGGDPNGFHEHHRLLLVKLTPGRWIAASPDFDLEVIDLNNRRHRILTQRSPFPADVADQIC